VKQELKWTLLGVWLALTEGGKHIPKDRRLSPVRVLRAVCDLVLKVADVSGLKVNLSDKLSRCVLADESGRKSDKNSKDYPRKKRKRSAGEPIVRPIKPELLERAMALLF